MVADLGGTKVAFDSRQCNESSPPHRQGSPPLGSPPSRQQAHFTEHCLHWASVTQSAAWEFSKGGFLLKNKGRKLNRGNEGQFHTWRFNRNGIYTGSPGDCCSTEIGNQYTKPKPNPHQVMLTFWGDGHIFSYLRIVFILELSYSLSTMTVVQCCSEVGIQQIF